MTLMELMESLGDRLGIVEKAHDGASTQTVKIQTRSVTLKDLAAEIQSEEVRSLAEKPSELTVSFDKIIETAGVAAGQHGWTIERLRELLLSDEFKKIDRPEIQKRILGVLAAAKVPVEDLVRDAIARDQALDSFEKFARKKLDDRLAARQHQISGLEEKVLELQKSKRDLAAAIIGEDNSLIRDLKREDLELLLS